MYSHAAVVNASRTRPAHLFYLVFAYLASAKSQLQLDPPPRFVRSMPSADLTRGTPPTHLPPRKPQPCTGGGRLLITPSPPPPTIHGHLHRASAISISLYLTREAQTHPTPKAPSSEYSRRSSTPWTALTSQLSRLSTSDLSLRWRSLFLVVVFKPAHGMRRRRREAASAGLSAAPRSVRRGLYSEAVVSPAASALAFVEVRRLREAVEHVQKAAKTLYGGAREVSEQVEVTAQRLVELFVKPSRGCWLRSTSTKHASS